MNSINLKDVLSYPGNYNLDKNILFDGLKCVALLKENNELLIKYHDKTYLEDVISNIEDLDVDSSKLVHTLEPNSIPELGSLVLGLRILQEIEPYLKISRIYSEFNLEEPIKGIDFYYQPIGKDFEKIVEFTGTKNFKDIDPRLKKKLKRLEKYNENPNGYISVSCLTKLTNLIYKLN